jgi:putative FmdB family regulatory protein
MALPRRSAAVLPTWCSQKMPLVMQMLFFGALLSAIKSTPRPRCWRPATSFTENIWRQFRPRHRPREPADDAHHRAGLHAASCWPTRSACRARRSTNWCRAPTRCRWWVPSCRWCAACTGSAPPPRARSPRWRWASAGLAAVPGQVPWGQGLPGPAGRRAGAFVGMVAGSLLPQWLANTHTPHRPLASAGLKQGLGSPPQAPLAGCAPIIDGLCERPLRPYFSSNSHAHLRLQVQRLRPCQGRLQKMSDAPLTVCPACGASAFEKQVTAAGFQLKGSGWYVTDFRDGGGKTAPRRRADKSGDAPKSGDAASPPAPPSTGCRPSRAGVLQPAPAPAAPPRAARLHPPALTERHAALRKWLFSGLLVIVPLVITLGGAAVDHRHARPDPLILPGRLAARLADRHHIPRLWACCSRWRSCWWWAPSPATSSASACWAGATPWCGAFRWCAPSIPASSRSPTRCSPRTATPFRTAVLVQWPRPDVWTIAFVTGTPGGDVVEHLGGGDYLSVYVPTTPNPTGGYFVMLAQRLHRTEDERGRSAQVRRLDGGGRSGGPARPRTPS